MHIQEVRTLRLPLKFLSHLVAAKANQIAHLVQNPLLVICRWILDDGVESVPVQSVDNVARRVDVNRRRVSFEVSAAENVLLHAFSGANVDQNLIGEKKVFEETWGRPLGDTLNEVRWRMA